MFGSARKALIKKISRELKDGAIRSRTFHNPVGGVETSNYRIEKYIPVKSLPSLKRALMFKTLADGTDLEVISAHEQGEPINAGAYDHQRDLAVRYARQEGVGYLEVDLDLIEQIRSERTRV